MRTDATILLGLLAGSFAFFIFPRVATLIHSMAMFPEGRRGLGSGFTTDVWGAFCPVVGILFATLISSTVDKLWARQEALRRTLVSEARLLSSLTELIYQADLADAAAASRAANEREVALYQGVSVPYEPTFDTQDTGGPTTDGIEHASFEPSDQFIWQQAESQMKPSRRDGDLREATGATLEPTDTTGQEFSSHRGTQGRRPKAGSPRLPKEGAHDFQKRTRLPKEGAHDQWSASYRCIARHLHTLSYLVWGSRGRGSSTKRVLDVSTERRAATAEQPRSVSLGAAYATELAMISGGEGVDPLVDLLLLHPPTAVGDMLTESSDHRGRGTAWAQLNAEVRTHVSELMLARGERLAVLESRPPRVHWLVLSFTGMSLVLGYAIVSVSTRPATNVISRLLFTALTSSLLAVMRLLFDLAEPFDGGGYTLSVKNTAGAILAPTRRRLVVALASRTGGGVRNQSSWPPRRLYPAGGRQN